jgi:hypothetical protein
MPRLFTVRPTVNGVNIALVTDGVLVTNVLSADVSIPANSSITYADYIEISNGVTLDITNSGLVYVA